MARNEDDNGGAMAEARTESKGQGLVRPRGLATRRRVRREKRGGAREKDQKADREAPKLLTGRGIGETKLLRGSSDAEYVPPRRHPDWIVEGEVAKFRVTGDGATAESANKVARSKEPVVLANTGFATKLCSKWTFAYLSRALDDAFVKDSSSAPAGDDDGEAAAPDPRVSVSCSMDKKNRFVHIDAGKNVYGSFYHVREPETIPLDSLTSFKDFADCAGKWTERHVAATKPLMRRRETQAFGLSSEKDDPARVEAALQENYRRIMRPDTMPDILLAPRSKAYTQDSPRGLPCLRGDLMTSVRWQWLFSFLGSQNFGSVRDCSLHCGTRNGLHPCKYEESERLVAQITGKTRFLLIPPSLAFTGLYPYPVHHPLDKYSMVDLEAGDEINAKHWPLFKEKVRGKECILHPGDVLYIPQYYFVHRQDLSAENSVLEFNISQGQRTQSEAAVPLKISRLLEERVAALESVREAQHWLSLIAHGEESEWIDTGTVRGHARIKFVESVHEEVEKNLGKNHTSPFLKSLTDRRLMPTPWLNKKAFREPLYLLDKPFTISDDRSELEKKYPEFFRTKLKKEGWSVPDSESTVPIPGYNC